MKELGVKLAVSKDVTFFEHAALTLLKGRKLEAGGGQLSSKSQRILSLLMKFHRGNLVAPEPQSYIRLAENRDIDNGGVRLGQTHINPVSDKIIQDAEHLKSVAILKDKPVAEFEVLGLNWDRRQSWRTSPDFKTDKVSVLMAGDNASLWQVMSLIRQRENGATGAPIIIQSSNMLWDDVFHTICTGWKKKNIDPKKFGIYFSSGAPDTADLLASFESVPRIHPKEILHDLAKFPNIKNPLYLFATTDDKKFNEIKESLKSSGAAGRIRRVFDILGKSEIPTEEKYSFEGNAAEKMEALVARIRLLGVDVVTQLLKAHGYNDISEVVLMTNDGGLGMCLENDKGERETKLFTKEFFPNTYQRMNQTQMSPGVELAYLMRTIGLEAAFSQLQKSVRSVCVRSKGKFQPEDLRAYDTSLQMFVPLTRVIEAIKNNEPTDLQSLGVVSVFSSQRLKVSPEPKGKWIGDVETINYLKINGTGQVRAEDPKDVIHWPNATGFRLLQRYAGALTKREDSPTRQAEANGKGITRMGLVATPSLLFARSASPQITRLQALLRSQYQIAVTNTGNDWRKYKDSVAQIIDQAAYGNSNSAYRAGIRAMLDKCSRTKGRNSVFYIGEQKSYANSMEATIIQGLAYFSAIVRNQVFNPVNFVVNRQAVPDLIKLTEHKKRLGLIGQAINQLMTLVDSEEEAAEAINKIVKDDNYDVTPLARQYSAGDEVENKQCMTATAYFSASNVNATLVAQAERLGYLMAVNGFNLKVGGGNDGLMRAASEGFQKGKRELVQKGYDFPNQLILVQCVDTESIERRYDGGGIYRCHPTIEAREADLQNCDFVVAGAGGAGTDEEIFAEFYSRLKGLTDASKKPFVLFNQQVQTKDGMAGVHDPYKEMFDGQFFKQMNVHMIMTPEEILAQAAAHRTNLLKQQQVISVASLRDKIKEASGQALTEKRFISPYSLYTGQEGKLQQASANEPKYRQFKVA